MFRPAPHTSRTGVRRQVVLPFGKSLAISYQSIRVRFFRSLITTLTLVLAVAFFAFVFLGNDIANGLLATGDPELRQKVIRAGYDVAPGDETVGAGAKQRWMVVLSFAVCMAGIVNAQLMAVTERFREIGTMKCLGALDRFILRLFLLEASLQGVAGSFSGAILGGTFAMINGLWVFGRPAWTCFPIDSGAASLGISLLVGWSLSIAGIVYPAWMAARMKPVEAMRVEH